MKADYKGSNAKDCRRFWENAGFKLNIWEQQESQTQAKYHKLLRSLRPQCKCFHGSIITAILTMLVVKKELRPGSRMLPSGITVSIYVTGCIAVSPLIEFTGLFCDMYHTRHMPISSPLHVFFFFKELHLFTILFYSFCFCSSSPEACCLNLTRIIHV